MERSSKRAIVIIVVAMLLAALFLVLSFRQGSAGGFGMFYTEGTVTSIDAENKCFTVRVMEDGILDEGDEETFSFPSRKEGFDEVQVGDGVEIFHWFNEMHGTHPVRSVKKLP